MLQVTGPMEVFGVEGVKCVFCRAFLSTKNSKYWKKKKNIVKHNARNLKVILYDSGYTFHWIIPK